MTYLEWLLPKKSHDNIITWSHKMATKLVRAGYTMRKFIPWSHKALWSRSLTRSCEKLDLLCHQNWQGSDLLWEATLHKVTKLFKHVVTWGHEISQKYIFTYDNACVHQTWQVGYMTFWSHSLARSCDKLNTLYLQCHNDYGHQTWQGSYIQ